MIPTSLYIHTLGCQMNVYDSDRITAILASHGIAPVDGPEAADIIVVNTCSVRDKAEQKAFSLLGRLAAIKEARPETILVVAGCVAQQEGERILARMPYVDLVIGPQAVLRLPALIQSIAAGGERRTDTDQSKKYQELPDKADIPTAGAISRFVTIMKGCDNFCSYCVVPYVRGREASRHPDQIIQEIESLVADGVREVTLLGQNVNSYGTKEGLMSFANLLARVTGIEGLVRVRFTTSHPKDISTELISVFGNRNALCRHIHLPVQSGSDAVLKRMNRGYTRADYIGKIKQLRQVRSTIAISTDIIVGFPGETDADHADTIALLEEIRYDGIFAFRYSDRPPAPAADYADKVADAVSKARLQEILTLQEKITAAKNESLVNTVQSVLIEAPSRHVGPQMNSHGHAPQWKGRTPCNRIVHVRFHSPSATVAPGVILPVRIEAAHAHSLIGRPETHSDGEQSHAA